MHGGLRLEADPHPVTVAYDTPVRGIFLQSRCFGTVGRLGQYLRYRASETIGCGGAGGFVRPLRVVAVAAAQHRRQRRSSNNSSSSSSSSSGSGAKSSASMV